jgi:quinol-cytochrome oxidoreductase complex cytochrome b subunit
MMIMSLQNWKKMFGLGTLDYPVPEHANTFLYSPGGITLFCFVVTMITGAILTQFYNSPRQLHTPVVATVP